MGNYAANAYKGKLQWYWEQARDTAADIGIALIQAAGNPADGLIQDYTTLAALWAGTADEATFANYARRTLANPSVSVDNALDQVVLSGDGPISFTNAGTASGSNNSLARALFFYDPAPGSSSESTKIPLLYQDISATTDGTTLVLSVNTAGLHIYKNTV